MVFLSMMLLIAFWRRACWTPPLLGERVPALGDAVDRRRARRAVATASCYLVFVGGNVAEFFRSEGLISGFFMDRRHAHRRRHCCWRSAQLVREREAQLRSQTLEFALERSRLEHQALDARSEAACIRRSSRISFSNTLANIQALVETGSPQAAPVPCQPDPLPAGLDAAAERGQPDARPGGPARRGLPRADADACMPDRLQVGVAVDSRARAACAFRRWAC
jgi:hypothetical protein